MRCTRSSSDHELSCTCLISCGPQQDALYTISHRPRVRTSLPYTTMMEDLPPPYQLSMLEPRFSSAASLFGTAPSNFSTISLIAPSTTSTELPGYPPPVNFEIGNLRVSRALVTERQLNVHLKVLGAFKNLADKIKGGLVDFPQTAAALDPDERWRWFLELSVERWDITYGGSSCYAHVSPRFQRWVRNTKFSTRERFLVYEVPPLDVFMVWHSYMLSSS
jgi:hypothetical protein